MAVITGILLLAFTSDGDIGSTAQKITLEEFRQDYRNGRVVLTEPDKYPIEVVSNDSSSNAVINAYVYKSAPNFTYAPFYMPFTESEELKTLFNRYGITETGFEASPVTQGDKVISTEYFRKLGEEGRILDTKEKQPRIIYTNQEHTEGVVVGEYRKNPEGQVNRKLIEPVSVTFSRAFQGDQVRDMLGSHAIYKVESNTWEMILINCLPVVIIFVILLFLFRAQGGGPSGAMKFARSRARLLDPSQNQITFKDVAGISEAKEEVWEIVEFLRNPQKFRNLGGTIPKGVLMVGPPGTGKTLLAKAIAGEADVPFYTISGSDFVEMFVGVGASRVRDLFSQAKEKAPCIIFIDEIDAVGRARGKNPSMGGNDERENTLNQLLTEMDGFGTNSGIIVMAATNRADILDKALLRAGRFDRQIHVDLPDLNERKEVFKVHLRPLKLDASVDIDLLARQTPGFSGADIANVCNEAALIAARQKKKAVDKQDFLDAVDRIIGGLEKKSKVMTAKEKETIAIHEAGHATLSWFLEHANPLIKVTIVPRGRALGAAWYLPEERQITTKEQMLDEMCAILGGRAAEELFTGHISTGAMNDLERVTKQAYAMVAYVGMSDKLPNLCYYNNSEYSFQRPYSENTAELIDNEVKSLIASQYERAKKLLLEHSEGHARLAQLLIEREVILAEDVESIFGKRPWTSRSEEIFENKDNNASNDEQKTEEQQ